MTSGAAKKVAKKAKRMVAGKPPAAGKAAGQRKPIVQALLYNAFSQAQPPTAEKIIAEVAKLTGREPLKLTTFHLYRMKFNQGRLGCQEGIKPKVPLANKW